MKSIIFQGVNPCNCEVPMMLPYKTYLFGMPICTTILCCYCRRKITKFSEKQAIKTWNEEVSK